MWYGSVEGMSGFLVLVNTNMYFCCFNCSGLISALINPLDFIFVWLLYAVGVDLRECSFGWFLWSAGFSGLSNAWVKQMTASLHHCKSAQTSCGTGSLMFFWLAPSCYRKVKRTFLFSSNVKWEGYSRLKSQESLVSGSVFIWEEKMPAELGVWKDSAFHNVLVIKVSIYPAWE